MKKIILGLIFSSLFAVCPDGFVEDDCGDCWASYCYDMNTHIPDYQTTEEACNEAGLLWVNPGDPGDPTYNSNCSESDHEEHCDEMTEEECSASDHCEWHADESACEDGDDHDGHDQGDEEHCDEMTEEIG